MCSCSISIPAIGMIRYYSSAQSVNFNLHFLIINEVEYIQIWSLVFSVSSLMNYLLMYYIYFYIGLFFYFLIHVP